jgi:hypothetical protein
MHYFGVMKLWSIHSTPLEPKWCLGVFQSVSLTFGPEKLPNLCSSLNALLHGTKVVKHPFYSIGRKLMFGSVSEHFANLRHVKRCNTCVRAWLHYFRVPKLRSIHSTRLEPKRWLGVFRSISLTFDTYKDAKHVFRGWMHYFRVTKLWSIHSPPLDPKWCLGVFQIILLTFGT